MTCSDMFAQHITMADGTLGVRMYEYERIRGTAYGFDAWLPEGSRMLFVRPGSKIPPIMRCGPTGGRISPCPTPTICGSWFLRRRPSSTTRITTTITEAWFALFGAILQKRTGITDPAALHQMVEKEYPLGKLDFRMQ